MYFFICFFFFFKQKTAYEMRISDWSSDVCSSDLPARRADHRHDPGGDLDQRTDLVVHPQADRHRGVGADLRQPDHGAAERFHARHLRSHPGSGAVIAPSLLGRGRGPLGAAEWEGEGGRGSLFALTLPRSEE